MQKLECPRPRQAVMGRDLLKGLAGHYYRDMVTSHFTELCCVVLT